jgi:hypothetical protein
VTEDIAAGIAAFAIIPLVGGAIVWALARVVRWRFPRLSLPVSLVFSHTALLLLCVALYPTGMFVADIPFDDLYLAYFLFPGTHISFLADKLVEPLSAFLFAHLSSHDASVAGVILLPGFIGLAVGGLQWYFIGRLVGQLCSPRMKEAKWAMH